jgi:DNA-binding NarL/FixJ family response regulator
MRTHGPIWVDDRNPIYRRGIVACLQTEGYSIAGESAGLKPEPNLSRSSMLVFDLDAAGINRVAGVAHRYDVRLVGLVREAGEDQVQGLLRAGLSGVLVRRLLTPPRLLSCVRAVSEGRSSLPPELLREVPAGRRAAGDRASNGDGQGGHLARRELDVLRLLADGDSTRDIAERLSYSERTVKSIVHDLLGKMNSRTRAHAVASATRQGII